MTTEFANARGTFDPETTSILSAAFDAAWQTVVKSGSPLAAPDRAAATREMLAQAIMADARSGERNAKRLTNNALARLASAR
jgi:hypothetical protein